MGPPKVRGIVRKWDDSRGYGFATMEDGKDVFLHYTQITGAGFKTLSVGDMIEFDLYEVAKGLEAKEIKKYE